MRPLPSRRGTARHTWSSLTIWLHWIMVPLILLILALGWSAANVAAEDAEPVLMELHYSLGLLAFLLVCLRLGWRLSAGAPRYLDHPRAARWAAGAVHFLLYFLLFTVLISGTVNFLFIGPVRVFGFFEIPRLFDPDADEWLRALSWYVHHYSWMALLALIGLHSAAALGHHYVRRDRTLTDFLPRPR